MLAWGLIALAAVLPATHWGIPNATHPLLARGWEVDGVAGISLLSELANLKGPAQADWYVAYPLFHYLVLAVVCAPVLAYLLATGQLANPGGEFPYGFADPVGALALLTSVGHGVSAAMAAGVVVGVFILARRIFDQRAGHFAAAVTLICAPFLFYARTANLDVPVLFWVVLHFIAIERAISPHAPPSRRQLAWCGVTAALAVATKDQAFGIVVLPLLAVLWRLRRTTPTSYAFRSAATLVLSGAVSFAFASGFAFRPGRFIKHLAYITDFENTFANVRVQTFLTVVRDSTARGVLQLLGDYGTAIGTAVGWPAFVLGVWGCALMWRSRPLHRWLPLSCVGLFLIVIVPIHHMQYRYALVPAVIAALGVAACVHGATLRWPQRVWLPSVLGAIAVASAIPGGAEISHAMWGDARWEAGRWLGNAVQSGDTLGFFGRPHQLPYLPTGVHLRMMGDTADAEVDLRHSAPEWIVVAPDYFSDSSRARSTFLPEPLYQSLLRGTQGYARVGRFETRPLLNRPLPYFPYVNPMVQVFQRDRGRQTMGDSIR